MRSAAIGLVAFASSGCYVLAEGGYVNPLSGAGGASFGLRGGAGDFREDDGGLMGETGLESDVRFETGEGFTRLGLGLSALVASQPGWEHDWTPFARGTLRLPAVEWLGHGAVAAAGVGVELGAAFFPDHGSQGRKLGTIAIGAEYAIRTHEEPNALFLGLRLGWGWSASLVI